MVIAVSSWHLPCLLGGPNGYCCVILAPALSLRRAQWLLLCHIGTCPVSQGPWTYICVILAPALLLGGPIGYFCVILALALSLRRAHFFNLSIT